MKPKQKDPVPATKDAKAPATGAKGWLGYRPEIKVLDCTIRDGGLMNDHRFTDEFVRAVYEADVAAGVDYMEMGYKASKKIFRREEHGTWKFSDEADIRRIIGDKKRTGTKISVMADAERTDYHEDILPKKESVLDMIRVATYIHQIPAAIDMIKDAHDKGYETTVNLMAVTAVPDSELGGALETLVNSEASTLYVVDSFGNMYSEQIRALVKKFQHYAKPAGKQLGIHTHNNMQLGFANTIEAIVLGANYVDASICGLGRGAGNCPMELILSFLHNPKFKLRPILHCIQHTVEPLREKVRWGFAIPYMLTGCLNRHPKTAMDFMEGDDYENIVRFYDDVIADQ
ncbi:MAG: nucleoid-structuring protein H-NS [Verrucomicrobia bacterium]|nr:nucleoid-structuring protein H-NS [Verrucomicrobiota bacterium]